MYFLRYTALNGARLTTPLTAKTLKGATSQADRAAPAGAQFLSVCTVRQDYPDEFRTHAEKLEPDAWYEVGLAPLGTVRNLKTGKLRTPRGCF